MNIMNKNYQLIKEAGYELKYDLSTSVFFDYYEPHVYIEKSKYSESSESYSISNKDAVQKFRDIYFMKLPESLTTNREELLNRLLNGFAVDAKRGSELDGLMLMMILDMPPLHAIRESQIISKALPPSTASATPKTQRGRL